MSFLICCEVSCSLDNHLKQIRPALCGPLYDGSMKACRWMEPPAGKEVGITHSKAVIAKGPLLDFA